MPAAKDHLDWAERNEQFAKSLDLSDCVSVNWAITAVFYAALHYVDAFFAARSDKPFFHTQRGSKIRDTPELALIWSDYRRLKDISREARYNLAPYTQVEFENALKRLEKVRSQVFGYLPH